MSLISSETYSEYRLDIIDVMRGSQRTQNIHARRCTNDLSLTRLILINYSRQLLKYILKLSGKINDQQCGHQIQLFMLPLYCYEAQKVWVGTKKRLLPREQVKYEECVFVG